MIRLTDIYTAVNKLLRNRYQGFKIYGNDVAEGFDKPSFFVNLIPLNLSNESVNYTKNTYSIKVTYFQNTKNEIDNLSKADEIRALFGFHLKVCDQLCHITDFSYDFVGKDSDILQITIDIEYVDLILKDQKAIANKLIMRTETR